MTQLENHMVLPHPTPSEYETEDYDTLNNNILKAWDDFHENNSEIMDYISNAKRYSVVWFETFVPGDVLKLQTQFMLDSVQKRVSMFNDLFEDSEVYEFKGIDYDLRILTYNWWVSL